MYICYTGIWRKDIRIINTHRDSGIGYILVRIFQNTPEIFKECGKDDLIQKEIGFSFFETLKAIKKCRNSKLLFKKTLIFTVTTSKSDTFLPSGSFIKIAHSPFKNRHVSFIMYAPSNHFKYNKPIYISGHYFFYIPRFCFSSPTQWYQGNQRARAEEKNTTLTLDVKL